MEEEHRQSDVAGIGRRFPPGDAAAVRRHVGENRSAAGTGVISGLLRSDKITVSKQGGHRCAKNLC